jgi:hypothetical protein
VTCDRFSPGTVSSNKTDHHDLTEILLKVALNTIILSYPILLVNVDLKFIERLYLVTTLPFTSMGEMEKKHDLTTNRQIISEISLR